MGNFRLWIPTGKHGKVVIHHNTASLHQPFFHTIYSSAFEMVPWKNKMEERNDQPHKWDFSTEIHKAIGMNIN